MVCMRKVLNLMFRELRFLEFRKTCFCFGEAYFGMINCLIVNANQNKVHEGAIAPPSAGTFKKFLLTTFPRTI